MSGITNFTDGEYERQLTIEQNKTNVLNAELNNRLNRLPWLLNVVRQLKKGCHFDKKGSRQLTK